MLTKKKFNKRLVEYIRENSINEELTSNDLREIRQLIRVEIAEIFFDLFKKRGTWIA